MQKPLHILFIGAGRMAEAIFSGMLQNELNVKITISNHRDQERLHTLGIKYPVQTVSNWVNIFPQADVIILACPPSVHDKVLDQMNPMIQSHQFVITVAAGIGPTKLEAALPKGTAVAWLMPNTAADVRKSMSIYTFGQYVTKEQQALFQQIVGAIGTAEQLTEQQVHDLTAITGSAPAFLYHFVEALEQSALSFGITKEQARKLVLEMVIGSAAMLDKHREPAQLREQVTSPGGATAAGLATLADNQFVDIIGQAVDATNKRAKQQGQE
ncbi:pyrroline-5-carboxylate reductase [Halalkalibacter alkalisediminis]|uniref:Pyrroline-5-carboxylate reductase n=1 Tax=Halalkalibacter alkalisediminis TaxID=935616 RepID=A0ABV6N9M9_9BACI|nr:pyrroline-5-carboxylate reductase [Halalkalibacter alkalisediminis]